MKLKLAHGSRWRKSEGQESRAVCLVVDRKLVHSMLIYKDILNGL